ncbi:hypothetical protein SCUCBS95973_004274 [Sporothrix curviconia]|uniref:Uncharacterized protein n=1 Tax=Sporothrix curviconia TaxID=1260050 RepID=A0ABP0BMB3_9PEZI
MPDLHLTVGFRADFLIGFHKDNGGSPAAARPQPPHPGPRPIRLPVRTTPSSHDRFLLDAAVGVIGKNMAVSEIVDDPNDALLLPLPGIMSVHRLLDKRQFWGTVRWFVSSPANSLARQVVPLPLAMLVPPSPGGSPQPDTVRWFVSSPANSLARQEVPLPLAMLAPPSADGSLQASQPQPACSWRPVTIATPPFPSKIAFPAPFLPPRDDPNFAACLQRAQETTHLVIFAPLERLCSSFVTQVNYSCTFVVHIGLGRRHAENDPMRLLALKKLATMLWLGGETLFAKMAGSPDMAGLPSLASSACLRVRPSGFEPTLLDLLDDQYSSTAYEEWLSPVLGPSPHHADVHEQVRKRSLVDAVLCSQFATSDANPADSHRLSTSLFSSVSLTADPLRLAELRREFEVSYDADADLAHELYLLWRAPDVDTVAKLLTPAFWQGPSTTPAQHCAFDFVNLRNDVRDAHPDSHHPTIAFRLFPATVDPKLVALWSQHCTALVHKAANCSPSEFLETCARLYRVARGDDGEFDFYSSARGDKGGLSGDEGDDEDSSRVTSDSSSGSDGGSDGDSDMGGTGDGSRAHPAPAASSVPVAIMNNAAMSPCSAALALPADFIPASAPMVAAGAYEQREESPDLGNIYDADDDFVPVIPADGAAMAIDNDDEYTSLSSGSDTTSNDDDMMPLDSTDDNHSEGMDGWTSDSAPYSSSSDHEGRYPAYVAADNWIKVDMSSVPSDAEQTSSSGPGSLSGPGSSSNDMSSSESDA